ncbi:MAG: PAS domain S-box protein [Cytophagaceae bacterium]|nr:MAG: PAS domain S-box protein [Cytophagaceae bacterium]
MIGQLADQLFTPEDQAGGVPLSEAQTAINQGRVEKERWYNRKDGTRLYGLSLTTTLHDEAGKLIGLLTVIRDLTTQKQAEEVLQL